VVCRHLSSFAVLSKSIDTCETSGKKHLGAGNVNYLMMINMNGKAIYRTQIFSHKRIQAC
jgi:hypothetical protein